MPKKSAKIHYKKMTRMLVTAVLASFALYLLGKSAIWFSTSVLSIPEHAPFNGTVYPIKKVPNWVKISTEKFKEGYSAFSSGDLVNIPEYDPNKLRMSTDNLKWGNAADDLIRNMKITYPVPYMGNYELDGEEYAGSHPAIDIKVPEGTPVYAMANGTVVKASNESSGFGHHIVLYHKNFPSFTSAKAKTTIYSSYSHLSDVLVDEGDVVKKGEQIGRSGMTGTATTPHLHFQIDNDESDWHPYWPFTWKEVADAGLNFFSAVNEALGWENAKKATINPLKYVQKYLDSSGSTSYVEDSGEKATRKEEIKKDNISNDSSKVEVDYKQELKFKITVNSTYYAARDGEFKIELIDQNGREFEGNFSGDLKLSLTTWNGELDESSISYDDFNGAVYTGKLTDMKAGTDRIRLTYNRDRYSSEKFTIVGGANDDGLFTDITENNKYYTAIEYLAKKKIVAGYPDGTFKPNKTVSRVEAIKLIMEGVKADMEKGNLPFGDTSDKEWYANYLYTAYSKKIIDGYPDGTFKPGNTVNKAEFYKILLNGMNVEVDESVAQAPFDDVATTDWYAPYFVAAKKLKIIDSDVKSVAPSTGMSRGEVAEAIYRLMKVAN